MRTSSCSGRCVGWHPRNHEEDWRALRAKFKGSAITGESKSYADLFDDTVAAKAKHLGMDQDKFEHELRKGNTNLLSYVLATTPAALQA